MNNFPPAYNRIILCFFLLHRIEILCHDINVHIPHHISPRIPSYNLRAAHQSLQENWGKVQPFLSSSFFFFFLLQQWRTDRYLGHHRVIFFKRREKETEFLLYINIVIYILNNWFPMLLQYMNEATWNWRLMKTILTVCHVYSKEKNYVAFDELAPEDSQPITFLKKLMPDYAWFIGMP